MKVTAAISGLHLRMDVKTKCKIVESVMTSNLKTKAELNIYIKDLANSIGVNPVTIKLWLSKYGTTYTYGLDLPDGVMSYTFLTIPQAKIPKVRADLTVIRNQLTSLRKIHEVPSIPMPAATIRDWKPSSLILEQLVAQSK